MPARQLLADVLVNRDREADDRRLCLECIHLQGLCRWRCGGFVGVGVHCRKVAYPTKVTQQSCLLISDNPNQRSKRHECFKQWPSPWKTDD